MLFWGAVGIWGLFTFIRGGRPTSSLAGAFVIGEVLVLIQVLAGVLLLGVGSPRPNPVHYLYGATAIIVLPAAWGYFRDRNPRQGLLIYSLLALFIMGLAIRGMTTGRIG